MLIYRPYLIVSLMLYNIFVTSYMYKMNFTCMIYSLLYIQFVLYCVFLVTPCIFVYALPLAGNKHVLLHRTLLTPGKRVRRILWRTFLSKFQLDIVTDIIYLRRYLSSRFDIERHNLNPCKYLVPLVNNDRSLST